LEGGATKYFRYDSGDSFHEVANGTSNIQVEFVRGSGMGGGIGSILYSDRGATREHFTYNAVGHTVALTLQTGAVSKSDLYEAYGNIVASTGSSSNNRLANTKERSFTLGLDNHGFRYYDPEVGRYISRDPIGYGDGLNVYLYVHNNPINHIDPLGLEGESVAAAEGRVNHAAIQEHLAKFGEKYEQPVTRQRGAVVSDGRVDVQSPIRQAEIKPSSASGIDSGVRDLNTIQNPEGKVLDKQLIVYKQEGKIPQAGGKTEFVTLTKDQAVKLNQEIKAGKVSNIWARAKELAGGKSNSVSISKSAAARAGHVYLRGRQMPSRSGMGRLNSVTGPLGFITNIIGIITGEMEAARNREEFRDDLRQKGYGEEEIEKQLNDAIERQIDEKSKTMPYIWGIPNPNYDPLYRPTGPA
jgi:RHS repeat-associated protein